MRMSVVTIVFNDALHIERTIESVISQTAFKDVEYILVDGASTDGTSDIIKKYAGQIAKYICEPDTGIYNAMNKGLNSATGDYVQFINSGDVFSDSEVLEKIIKSIGDNTPDVVYGHYRESMGDNTIGHVIPCREVNKIWYGPVASHQSILYRVNHLKSNGIEYDESYKIAADYKLTAEAIKKASAVLKTDICISDFDVSGISSTNQNKGLAEANRVRREVFGWGIFRIMGLSVILLCARYAKKFAFPLYSLIRNKQYKMVIL